MAFIKSFLIYGVDDIDQNQIKLSPCKYLRTFYHVYIVKFFLTKYCMNCKCLYVFVSGIGSMMGPRLEMHTAYVKELESIKAYRKNMLVQIDQIKV